MLDIQIQGLDDLNKSLLQLPTEIAQKELTKALKDGAEIIADEMRDQAPRETHDRRRIAVLAEHIRVQVEPHPIGSAAEVYIGPDKVVAYRARWMEYGTTAHAIVTRLTRKMMKAGSKRKKVLASSDQVFGPIAHHPGVNPRPFMRPALDRSSGDAISAIKQALSDGIQRAAKRLNKSK